MSSSMADRGVVRSMVLVSTASELTSRRSSIGSLVAGAAAAVVEDDAAAVVATAAVSLHTEIRDPLRLRIFRIFSVSKSVDSPIDGVAGLDPDASELASLRTAVWRSVEPDLASSCGLVMRQWWHSQMPDGMSCSLSGGSLEGNNAHGQ